MDRLQRHEALTGPRGGGRRGGSMSRRHGRFHHAGRGGSDNDDGGCGGPTAAVAVVDQAECTGRSCQSCVAVTLADCIALGCCPCAVVSLLGLAFVKAPLAVGRRCVRRLRRRQGRLRHKKRVRDLDLVGSRAGAKSAAGGGHGEPGAAPTSKGEDDVVMALSPGREVAAASDAEKVWLEMYQVGHWGFGRLSFSVNPPTRAGCAYVATGRSADGCGNDVV